MTLSRSNFYVRGQLDSCRVARDTNLNGSYFNGPTNNGVGATLTNAGALAALQIDSRQLNNGDRVLLFSQTSAAQNGIYQVIEQGSAAVAWVLERTEDFRTSDQINAGFYMTIKTGLNYAGSVFTVVEPSNPIVGVGSILIKEADSTSVPITKFFSRQITTNGGSNTLTIPFSPSTTEAVCVGNWDRSTNAVSVQKVTAGEEEIVVLSSGDPGTNSVFSFILTTEEF